MNSFIEATNSWGERLLHFAGPMLWQSSLLILVVFALDLALRKKLRAAVRYALWLVVLVKLLLPPGLALPTSLAWWARPAQAPPPASAKPPKPQFVVTYDTHSDRAPEIDWGRELPLFQGTARSLTAQETEAVARLSVVGWVGLAAVSVGMALLVWMLVRWWQVTSYVKTAVPAPESVNELLSGVCRTLKMRRRVAVRVTDRPMSPAVCGLFRATVLLPQALVEQFSSEQLRAVLLHELIHLRRGDVWVNCAQALLQIFYWWHPLLWFANARIRRVREEAVDDAVMLALRDNAEAYAPTLLEVAKLAFNRPLASLGLVGILESKSALRQRVERLVYFKAPRRAGFSVLSAIAIAAFAAMAAPMGDRPPVADRRAAFANPAAEAANPLGDKEKSSSFVDISSPSGSAVYDPNAATITATGRARAVGKDFALTADTIAYDQKTGQLKADGNVVAEQIGEVIHDNQINQGATPGPNAVPVEKVKAYELVRRRLMSLKEREHEYLFDPQKAYTLQHPLVVGVQSDIEKAEAEKAALEKEFPALRARDQAVASEAQDTSAILFVRVAASGDYRVRTNQVGLAELRKVLAEAVQKDSNVRLMIEADQQAPYKAVSDLMEVSKDLGIANVSIKTPTRGGRSATEPARPKTSSVPASSDQKLLIRTYRVDPNAFYKGMEAVLGFAVPATNNSGSKGFPTIQVKSAITNYFAALGVDLNPALGKTVFWNDRTAELLVRATEEEQQAIETAIQMLNRAPYQVNVKARFVEITSDDAKAIGFDWNLGAITGITNGIGKIQTSTRVPSMGAKGDKQGQALPLMGVLNPPQYAAVLKSLARFGGADILSAPEVTTLSGQSAQIQVVDIRTIVNGVASDIFTHPGATATNVMTNAVYQTAAMPFGPVLDIVAYVSPDASSVKMAILASVTEFIGYDDPGQFVPHYPAPLDTAPVPEKLHSPRALSENPPPRRSSAETPMATGVLPLPHFRLRQMTTSSAVLRDGQTLVMGGLITEDVSRIKDKVPVLGDLPLVGKLFRSESAQAIKKNLILFLTPTILDQGGNSYHEEQQSRAR